MAKSFTAQVDQMIANSKEAMLAVVQGSLRDMTNDMQIPVAKGGRMRVIRASFAPQVEHRCLAFHPVKASDRKARPKASLSGTVKPSTPCCWT